MKLKIIFILFVMLMSLFITEKAYATPNLNINRCNEFNALAVLSAAPYNSTVYLCKPEIINLTEKNWRLLEINSGNRIWMHQFSDNKGWADCFHSAINVEQTFFPVIDSRDSNAGNIQLSSNKAYC